MSTRKPSAKTARALDQAKAISKARSNENLVLELTSQRDALLAALEKLVARGFFEPSTCADAATNADMAELRAAIVAAGGAAYGCELVPARNQQCDVEMVKVDVSTLSGKALDWAVAMAVGEEVDDKGYLRRQSDCPCYDDGRYNPSTSWSDGGPMIEQSRIVVAYDCDGSWVAGTSGAQGIDLGGDVCLADGWSARGDSYLIAGCRAIVVEYLGTAIEVPAELLTDLPQEFF